MFFLLEKMDVIQIKAILSLSNVKLLFRNVDLELIIFLEVLDLFLLTSNFSPLHREPPLEFYGLTDESFNFNQRFAIQSSSSLYDICQNAICICGLSLGNRK